MSIAAVVSRSGGQANLGAKESVGAGARLLTLARRRRTTPACAAGSTLVEILVALAIVAVTLTVVVAMLQAAVGAVASVHEQTLAAALARSQMETIKSSPWPGPYPTVAAPAGYQVTAGVGPGPLSGLQIITVTVRRDGRSIVVVQGYKGQR